MRITFHSLTTGSGALLSTASGNVPKHLNTITPNPTPNPRQGLSRYFRNALFGCGYGGVLADLGVWFWAHVGEGTDDRADRADAGAWRLWRGPDGHGWPAGRLCGHDSAARRPAAAASVSPSSRRPAGRCSVDHHGDTRRSAGVMGCSIGASSRAVSGSARPWMCARALHHAACAAHHTSRTSQNLVDLTRQPEGCPRRLAEGSCHSHS